MKSADNVGITFANLVLGRGVANGVVNITLGAFEFNPSDDGKAVEPSPVITCRLRQDIPGARALHEALGSLLESIDKPQGEAAAIEAADNKPEGRPN